MSDGVSPDRQSEVWVVTGVEALSDVEREALSVHLGNLGLRKQVFSESGEARESMPAEPAMVTEAELSAFERLAGYPFPGAARRVFGALIADEDAIMTTLDDFSLYESGASENAIGHISFLTHDAERPSHVVDPTRYALDYASLKEAVKLWLTDKRATPPYNVGERSASFLAHFVNDTNERLGIKEDALPVRFSPQERQTIKDTAPVSLMTEFQIDGRRRQLVTVETVRNFAVSNGLARYNQTNGLNAIFTDYACSILGDGTYYSEISKGQVRRLAEGLYLLRTHLDSDHNRVATLGVGPAIFTEYVAQQKAVFGNTSRWRNLKWVVAEQFVAALEPYLVGDLAPKRKATPPSADAIPSKSEEPRPADSTRSLRRLLRQFLMPDDNDSQL